MLFRALVLAASLLVVLGLATQVIWPACRNRRLFPVFRKESRLQRAERLSAKLRETQHAARREAEVYREALEAEDLESKVNDLLTQDTERRSR
jgi:hypothetical protein